MLVLGSLGETVVAEATTTADTFTCTALFQRYMLLATADVYLSKRGEADDQAFLLTAGEYATIDMVEGEVLSYVAATGTADLRITAIG